MNNSVHFPRTIIFMIFCDTGKSLSIFCVSWCVGERRLTHMDVAVTSDTNNEVFRDYFVAGSFGSAAFNDRCSVITAEGGVAFAVHVILDSETVGASNSHLL